MVGDSNDVLLARIDERTQHTVSLIGDVKIEQQRVKDELLREINAHTAFDEKTYTTKDEFSLFSKVMLGALSILATGVVASIVAIATKH